MASNHTLPSLRKLLLLTCAGLALAGWPQHGFAADQPYTLTARAGVHDDFDRLVFDAARNLTYQLRRDGNRVTVTFSHPAMLNLRAVAASHMTRARDVAAGGDAEHPSISFTVAPKATLKDFSSGASVVIDIFGPTVSASDEKTPNEKAAEPKPAPPVVPPVADEKKADAKTAEPPAVPVAALLQSTATVFPKPSETLTPEAAKVPPSPAPQLTLPAITPPTLQAEAKPNPNPVKTPELAKTAPAKAEPAKPEPAPAPVAAPSKTPPVAAAPVAPAPPPALAAAAVPMPEVGFAPELMASLNPGVSMGAVIFMRGGYGYIVFDRKLTLDKTALTAGQPATRVSLEPLDLLRNSGFRFAVPADTELRATRNGNVWQLFLSRQHREITVSTGLVAQPDFALGARMLMPTTNAPEPVRFKDPVIGDDLILVPLRETEAFTVLRHHVDFDLIPSAQGMVIKPRHEKVAVRAVSDGVEISATGGLRLSAANDTGASGQSDKKAKAAAAGKSLFDFAMWGGKASESFTSTRQRMMQTVVDVPEAERNRARLELARFYFAHGMGEETLSLLGFLSQQVPELSTHAEFLALRGAARILAFHAKEGLQDLSDPDLNFQPEIELWQAVASSQLRDWKTAEEKFALTEGILTGYPEPFYSRFSVLAIEAAVAMDKDREAAEWLDRLETGPHLPNTEPALQYLRGVLHSKSGRAKVAQGMWRDVAASNDRLYKTRADLALIDLGVATNSLTPVQAADKLEGLRFAWRGDDLELDILHRLGSFYIDARNFKSGLATLSQAVRLFPDSPLTPPIRAEMAATFHDIYVGGKAKDMSPVEALTLFREYQTLMPSGDEGRAVTRNLVERLVAIDLLDQAAELLGDQIKGGLDGAEKAETGMRMAALRLLDHKPDGALAALDMSDGSGLPAPLQNERKLLRARALSEQHKDDEALELLKGENSAPSKMLRADITMRGQRWAEAAKALSELIGSPPKAGENLTPQQADWLVNDAIALALAGDTAGLDRLAIDFGAAMAGTNQSDTFRVLTRPEKAGQMRDIAAAQSKITEVDMFRTFLDSYRGGPPPEEKKAEKK